MGTSKTTDKIHITKFPEDGIFEYAGVYTEMFVVNQVSIQDVEVFMHRMEHLLLEMPRDCVFQMVVHNTLIDKNDYLKTILVPLEKMPQAELYDKTIIESVDIGCNNIKKYIYLVVGCKAATPEAAKKYFNDIDPTIEAAFNSLKIKKLTTLERLEDLYHIFNPRKNAFGYELDLRNDGNISLSNLKHVHMTEKDLIAPKTWDTQEKLDNHTVLDSGLETESFSRTLFLNCIPTEVSINVISDLTSVSSNMLFSISYNYVDAELGYDAASEVIKNNTTVTKKQKRETIQDKKNNTVITFTERKQLNESVYFHEEALEVLKKVKATDSILMEVSIMITLFADTLEELNRNTEMLKISAAKFACSVKCLNKYQYEGFCSSLPLCEQRVNVSRFLTSQRLAQLSPISAATENIRGGGYMGLNAINDNLIIYNRKQGINLTGVICGTEHSGKTFQARREILNAMLTTNDKINVIACDNGRIQNEYDKFIERLGGNISYLSDLNPFYFTKDYGLTEDDKTAKLTFLSAFSDSREEAEALMEEMVDFSSLESVLDVLSRSDKYPKMTAAVTKINESISRPSENKSRLSLYKVSSLSDLLVSMEQIWNQSIEDKKNDRTNWVFIDNVDNILQTDNTLIYLLKYLKNSSNIRNVVTLVIQDAVGLMTSASGRVTVEELVTNCGYVKLMNQGPIERKKFVETLNIPNALIPYITNVEPGHGVIVTPASNMAFNDNFLEKDNEFTKIFM